MKKMKMILATMLSVVVVLGGVIPVNAASSEVTFEVMETDTNVGVTVPSQMPIVFNEDGTNTYPKNWKITNDSNVAGVYLSKMTFAPNNGWTLLGEEEQARYNPANTKSVRFFIGTEDVMNEVVPTQGVGVVNYSDYEIAMPAGTSQVIKMNVERGAFTERINTQKSFDIELNFEFI